MHYDNPNGDIGIIDNSGLRMYYTETLRDYDAEVFVIGASTSQQTLFLPPKLEHSMIIGYCDLGIDYFSNLIPDEGVIAFANMLHAHQAGTALRLRHIRDGKELKPIDSNAAYDFDYQQTVSFDEIRLYKGDKFIIECIYDTLTSDRHYMTYGGESSREEMVCTYIY